MGTKLDMLVFFLLGITMRCSLAEESSRERRTVVTNKPQEYCESQTFSAKCWRNEVVVMQSAFYGRMAIGKCVEASLGYLGCKANVLDLLDRRCSGKQECEIRVPDPGLDKTKPCYKELKIYLETSFTCIRVVNNDQSTCRASTTSQISASSEHLASTGSSVHGCGRPNNPWVLEAQGGQRLNLTLIDFSWDSGRTEEGTRSLVNRPKCIQYGYLFEKNERKNITICGQRKREQHINLTSGHRVHFVNTAQEQHNFLLRFEAVGCPDLRAPKDAWFRRKADEATVGCEVTRQTWHLTCRDRQWVGVIGNCTQHLLAATKDAILGDSPGPIPHGVAIVVIVGVALIICSVIVCIGVVCIRRYTRMPQKKTGAEIKYNGVKQADDDTLKYNSRYGNSKTVLASEQKSLRNYAKRNEYSHIFDMPLPEPGCKTGSRGGSEPAPPYVVYGGSGRNTGLRSDDNYNVSLASKAPDDSRYYVLDREALPGNIPEDPDC